MTKKLAQLVRNRKGELVVKHTNELVSLFSLSCIPSVPKEVKGIDEDDDLLYHNLSVSAIGTSWNAYELGCASLADRGTLLSYPTTFYAIKEDVLERACSGRTGVQVSPRMSGSAPQQFTFF